jgi:hypothetical protein
VNVDVTGEFIVAIYRIHEDETFRFSELMVPTYQMVQRHFWEINVILKNQHLQEKLCLLFLHSFTHFSAILKTQNSKALVLYRL